MARAKGIYEYASAIKLLNNKYKNLNFIMLGNADDKIKSQILKNSDNAKNIKFLPAQKQEKLADIMRESDIFVLPSYYEGLGLIAIEALACLLRVVCTKIEGLQQLLKEKINNSSIIEYVDLPRLYDVDKIYEEDKEDFINRLYLSISLQIERINEKLDISEDIKAEINKHSWGKIIENIYDIARGLDKK